MEGIFSKIFELRRTETRKQQCKMDGEKRISWLKFFFLIHWYQETEYPKNGVRVSIPLLNESKGESDRTQVEKHGESYR